MRKGLLTLICAGCALGLLALAPGSALATAALTISNGTTTATVSGGGCTFTAANGGAQTVNVADIDACLVAGNSVTVDDPSGGGQEIDVQDAIAPATCTGGTTLTLHEADGPIVFDHGAVTLGSTCDVDLNDDDGAISQSTAPITADELTLGSEGAVTLNEENTVQTVTGTVGGDLTLDTDDPLRVDALNDPSGDVELTGDGINIAGALNVSGNVTLSSDSTVTQTADGTITAARLQSTSDASTTLTNADNQVPTFAAPGDGGTVDFTDAEAAGLTVNGISADTGYTIVNSGDVILNASERTAAGVGSLTSQDGDVLEETGGGTGATQLSVYAATGVSLTAGANYVNTLTATATTGSVAAYVYEAAVSLGAIAAPDGSVSVTNDDDGGSLDLTGAISAASSVALNATGFTAGGGSLAAPSIAVTDTDTSDAWTVTPSSITAGTGTVAYSGVSNLSIGGGATTFNVTPSTTTSMSLDGGSPAAGTLNYSAGGGLVTGTTTPPSGTIDNSEFEPVSFSGMTAVNVTGAATPPTTTTTTTTTTSGGGTTTTTTTPTTTPASTLPACTLRASSSKVTLPKRVRGKLKGKPTLTLVASCKSAVSVALSGRITVVSKGAHGKTKSKSYALNAVKATLGANAGKKLVLDLPAAVVSALSAKGDKLSATFTLVDSAGKKTLKTASIKRLT